MKKGRGYWLETASSGAKFEKWSKYDETQSYHFCAYHSFGNSCSCITAVKWDAYDVENTADKARRYRINSKNSSLFHLGDNKWNFQRLSGYELAGNEIFLRHGSSSGAVATGAVEVQYG